MKDGSGKEIKRAWHISYCEKQFLFYSHTDMSKKPVNLKSMLQVSILIFFLCDEEINHKGAILYGSEKIY